MLIEIDARGLACPKPVINTKKELDKLQDGIILVTVDNSIAKENILKLSKSLNCEAKITKEEEDLIVIEIKKGKNVIIEDKKDNELEDKCIFISSDKMGEGNDELGEVLIKGFIYTLTEAKPYPKYIVFVNSAVKLTAQNKSTIENLKVLEECGVEILSCGTCLDYYNLKETLQVGSVTNMYNIVDIMKNSSQTISI
ncbi:sulfurtransferase-like selenium metabolism protein YedF [Romboutsia sp.]|uniref:sulfurtransferase-like selenium metabolism protein YedF n=1 Tax=Romboutsia sp. TaxID=1965302 RepID=UPI002C125305|nr:sulfurtransferase-like selenium metabolism protein YedF [Romboutsia sp.]HSQ90111.1 sulfurtransferase-like selenium metabolism protein YedF [Romboutsia sp.]